MDIVFSGSYQTPTIIEVPGLVATSVPAQLQAFWGEDVTFTFPAVPAADLEFVIKANLDDSEPTYSDTEDSHPADTAAVFILPGAQARKLLEPGIYYYALLSHTEESYSEIASGIFTMVLGASSGEIDPAP